MSEDKSEPGTQERALSIAAQECASVDRYLPQIPRSARPNPIPESMGPQQVGVTQQLNGGARR